MGSITTTQTHRAVYGPRTQRYLEAQRRHFEKIGHPLVGQHGRRILERAVDDNIVTLDTLETERPANADNGVLAQVALYHPHAYTSNLPRNLPPNGAWVEENHKAICAFRELDSREGTTLADYQEGPLNMGRDGLPPLAFLVRMAALTTLMDPRIVKQMPPSRTQYFPYVQDLEAYNTIVSRKVLELYAPFAEVLGFGGLCRALKNMAVRYVYPEKSQEVTLQMAALRPAKHASDMIVGRILARLNETVATSKIQTIHRGEKGQGSSVIKLITKPEKYDSVEDFSDLAAAFVLVDSIHDVYAVVEALTGMEIIPKTMAELAPAETFRIVPEDWIAAPKTDSLGSYQSYHIDTLIDQSSSGRSHVNFEIIVRTREMHYHSERGGAAHWLYKGNTKDPERQQQILRKYEQLLLALVGGSMIDDAFTRRRLTLNVLAHERPIRVTIKCVNGKDRHTTRTVQLSEGTVILDALVAAGVDLNKGVKVLHGKRIVDPLSEGDVITAQIGGARRLSRGGIRNMLQAIRTHQAAKALGEMLKAH